MSLSLDDRQRRELWGLALLALALLLALSLIPVALLGAAALRVFATGNVVGVIGAWLNGAAWGFLGVGGFAVPVLLALWGLVAFGKLDAAPVVRWTLLLSGLAILVPAAVGVSSSDDGISLSAGWLGTAIGGLLTGLLSPVGAGLVLFFLFAGLCVVTLRWNPLRTMVRGTRAAGRGAQGIVTAMPAIADKLPRPSMPTFTKRTADDSGDEEPDRDYEGGYDGEYGGRAAAFRDEDEDDPFEGDRFEASFPPAAAGRRSAVPASPNGDEATLPFPAPRANGSASPASPPDAVVEAASSAAAAKPAKKAARAASDENADPLPVDTGDPLSGDKPGTMLLDPPPTRDEMRNRAELDKLGQVLIDKLATFKIEGTIVGMTTGPVVTQFEVSPAPGIKVARIASLDADLALAMRAPSIRIVAPIPGKGAVGVEVPNPEPEMVFFREVIESPQFRGSKASLPLALGKDIAGKPHVADLAKMPHLLIAGATGSGKSVCVNTIITSLIYRHSPQTLRFLMVDPKMVELSIYNDLPHLRHPVVTDNNDAATVLKWAVLEMERRYELLSVNGVRNLGDFNKKVETGSILRSPEATGEEGDPDRWLYKGGELPFIVIIIDELADLMMTVQGDVEKPLALLAQKARAIGIHLILATQRPSVNVITGLIKANFPSRIAFRVSSKVDSRTILDQNGADNLLGNGDMLLLPPASSEPVRVQGAYLSTEETERLMDWYRQQKALRREQALAEGFDPDADREGDILDEVRSKEDSGSDQGDADDAAGDRDKLFRDAAELCIQHQGGSTSLLQRRLRIGYGRAARIIDQLHMAGVLGPPDGSKPRDVLVDFGTLDHICGGE